MHPQPISTLLLYYLRLTRPLHIKCEEILAEETRIWPDFTDQHWPGEMTWFTDGSSFVVEGKRRAGAALVD